jgi:hypothetical protein
LQLKCRTALWTLIALPDIFCEVYTTLTCNRTQLKRHQTQEDIVIQQPTWLIFLSDWNVIQPVSFWILSKHLSRKSLLVYMYIKFTNLLCKFHRVSTAYGTVRSQAVLTKSECFGEAERKDKNPAILIKNSFSDFTVEHACFITKFNWWS